MLTLRTRPYHLFILLTLLQAFLFPQVSAQYNIPDPEACLEGGYYECSDSCPCGLTSPDNALNIILCVISLLFSFTMVAGYVGVKELRDKPGDIIFALAIADILFAVGGIMSTLTHLQNDYFDPNDTSACNASSVINIVAIGMTYCYHIAFFIYYMTILRTSLKGGNVPGSVYHIFPLLGTTLFTLLLYQQGYVGRSIYGVCEMKTSPGIILPIISNVFILVIIYVFAHFTRKYTPQSERISSLRSQFVMFYLKYLVAISIIYIAKGVLSVLTGVMLNDILQDTIDSGLINELNAVKICFDILNGLTPVILTLGRLNDPLIQQHWKRLFRTITKKESSETGLTETLKRGSLNVKEFQVELEMQSHVQQFQHSRRVEVLYSLLSGIHYFWNVKQMNKLIELAPLRFSPDEKDPNEDYIKESKNFRTLFVQKETLTKQVPELFAEIKEKHYQPAKGTLTAFAPRLFEEIIELDSVGRGIRQSLDLKQNFSRILKSGVNGGGKSGEFFFFSADNKFIIKTVSNAEVEVLVDILPAYAKYLKLNPDSVIAKIYGVFKFEIAEPYERYNLILMRNINGYPSDCVDRKYDLKGSTVGRISIREPNVEFSDLKNRGVLKDLDFDKFEKKIHTSLSIKQNLYDAIKKDIGFLSSMKLVDYSLALYVVDRRKYMRSLLSISSESEPKDSEDSKQSIQETELRSTKSLVEESGVPESESLVAFKSTNEDKWYHLGIIDYLIPFGLKKRSEVFFKKLGALDPSLDISVQKPDFYGKRFVGYVEKILKN